MYFYNVRICAVTSRNKELWRNVVVMATSPWEAMKKVSDIFTNTMVDGEPLTVINASADRDEYYECIVINDAFYEDAGYKMEDS